MQETAEYERKLPMIQNNHEQYEIFLLVKEAVENNKRLLLNIDGPGGSGKTFLTIFLSNYIRYVI